MALRSPAALAILVAVLAALAAPAARAQDAPVPPASVVVGAEDYPPYEFLDGRGQPAGFNVDLTRAIADVMRMTVELRFGRWEEIRAGLDRGEIDVLQGITWSEERARSLDSYRG